MEAGINQVVTEHTISSIDQAPPCVGLYAWYHNWYLSEADLRQLEPGVDAERVRETVRGLLEKQTRIFADTSIKLEGRGNFGSAWSADVRELGSLSRHFGFEEQSTSESGKKPENNKSKTEFSIEENSRLLIELLQRTFVHFNVPVYIGKSDCLRTRLGAHARDFRKIRKGIREEPRFRAAVEQNLISGELDFAHRAAISGLTADDLTVRCINFETLYPGCSTEYLYDCAGTIEYSLNRWIKPHLGRS